MTISFEGVTAGDEADSQDFFKRNYYVNFTPVPTKNDEYYFVGLVSATDYEFETAFGSDEEFMSSVISAAGENIMLNCFLGQPSAPLKGQLDYKGNQAQNTISSHSATRTKPPHRCLNRK